MYSPWHHLHSNFIFFCILRLLHTAEGTPLPAAGAGDHTVRGVIDLFLCHLAGRMAALTDHRDKMSRFQRLRSVFSVEWDEVDPARVVKQPGRMQAQRLLMI